MTDTNCCSECGHVAPSTYCPNCGQRQDVDHRNLRALVRDFFGDFLTFDSKVFVSLRWLLFRPGWLTLTYIEGKRTRYVTPLRLYLFFSVVFFLMLSYGADTARAAGEHVLRLYLEGPAAEAGGSESVIAKLPYVLLALVPVFAWLSKIVHRRRRDFVYMDHLIFALHFHAAFFVVASVAIAARLVWLGTLLAPAWALLYVYLGLRRIFRERPRVTVGRALAITIVYGLVAVSISFLAAAWLLVRGGGGTLIL